MVKLFLTVILFALLVVLWPAVYWVSSYLRFGSVDLTATHELILFIPMGVIGALAVILPQLTRKYSECLLSGLLGYLVATPITYFATLFGGLILPTWFAATILGSVPLLVFTFIGYKIGEKISSHKQGFHHFR